MIFLRRHFPIWFLLAGACFPLARVLMDPTGVLPGTEASDVYKHAWGYWHTLALIRDGTWPHSAFLNAPDGGVLMDVMLLPSLMLAPITLVGGPVLAANIWVILCLLAVGGATYALAKEITGSRIGALCAGLLVQSCPFILGYGLTSGVHERLGLWIFPFLLVGLFRLRGGKGVRWPFLLTGATFLVASQCPTFGVFIGLLLLFVLPVSFWKPAALERRRRLLIVYTYGGAGIALLAAYLMSVWFISQPNYLAALSQIRVEPTLGVGAWSPDFPRVVATPGDLLNPWAAGASQPDRHDDELYKLVYIGWILLMAMVAGVVSLWRQRRLMPIAVAGISLVFFAMSMGPQVDIGGEYWLPNPVYWMVSAVVPFIGAVPHAWEMAGMGMALSSVLVAGLIGGIRRRWVRGAVGMLLVGGIFVERALVLPIPVIVDKTPARITPVYAQVPRGGAGKALADIPRHFPGTQTGHGYLYLAQTQHEAAIPVAIDMGISRMDDYLPVSQGISADWSQAAACMARNGIRWVVVHSDWFNDRDGAKKCAEGLAGVVGSPLASDSGDLLFDLNTPNLKGHSVGPACPSGPREPALGRQDIDPGSVTDPGPVTDPG